MTEKLVLRKQHLNGNGGTKPIFVDVSILDSIREIEGLLNNLSTMQ